MTSLLVKKTLILLANQKQSIELYFKFYNPLLREKKNVSEDCGQDYRRADATRHQRELNNKKNISAQTVCFFYKEQKGEWFS